MESEFEESDEEYQEMEDSNEVIEPSEVTEDEEDSNVCFLNITEALDDNINSTVIYCLPKHRRCACHTLNLVAKNDLFKNLQPSLKKLMESTERKLAGLWKKQSRSSKASDIIQEKLNSLFIVHNKTRWNSYFHALERVAYFLKTKKYDLKLVYDHFRLPYLRPAEEECVKEYVKIMKPLAEALDILQADKKISVGYLLPTLFVLLNKMEALNEKSTINHCKPLIKAITSSVKNRFSR